MEQALRNLMQAANDALTSNGIRMRFYEQNGAIMGQALVPTVGGRPLLISAGVMLPSDVVGGKLGKKIKAKAKSIAKKVVKSKLLKGIAKAAATLAVPGGAQVMMGVKAVKLAKKLKHAATHGSPKQKAVAKAIAHKAASNIKKARSAPPVPQGYPDAYASALPGEDAQQQPGNGLPDAPDEDLESEMDPDQDAPSGEVEQDQDDEITPDDDTSDSDEPE